MIEHWKFKFSGPNTHITIHPTNRTSLLAVRGKINTPKHHTKHDICTPEMDTKTEIQPDKLTVSWGRKPNSSLSILRHVQTNLWSGKLWSPLWFLSSSHVTNKGDMSSNVQCSTTSAARGSPPTIPSQEFTLPLLPPPLPPPPLTLLLPELSWSCLKRWTGKCTRRNKAFSLLAAFWCAAMSFCSSSPRPQPECSHRLSAKASAIPPSPI